MVVPNPDAEDDVDEDEDADVLTAMKIKTMGRKINWAMTMRMMEKMVRSPNVSDRKRKISTE